MQTPDDMVLGSPQAPVTLIEFASASCPHCAHFHETAFAQLRANYIDAGKVFFIYREMLTSPAQLAYAGFQLARCNNATPDQYFDRLGQVFARQQEMYAAGTMQGVLTVLSDIGVHAGLSSEQVLACLNDPNGQERIRRFGESATQFNVTGTPTFILNGQKLDVASAVTYEGLAHFIDQAIAAHH